MVGGHGRWGLGGTRWMVYYACALHLVWAGLLAYNPVTGQSTPVSAILLTFHGRWQSVVALFVVAVAALVGVQFWLTHSHPVVLPSLLVPQQLLLFLSAGAGLHAAAAGHYADGVPRPWEFITADQLPVVLAAFLYTTALVSMARRPA